MATLMVLLIFNLKGAGYAIILPRVIDTLLGCAVAWFAVSFIWPDWNFRNISNNIRNSSQACVAYFSSVIEQYQTGRNNSMAYRIARRLAHNSQIELSTMISSLSAEPHPNPELIHSAFRYLVYSHSQLSYISALGSHREKMEDPEILALMQKCQQMLHAVLQQHQPLPQGQIEQQLREIKRLAQSNSGADNLMLVLKQISLILETLPELINLRTQLLQQEIR
jgi:uncharacterized membrane protein YccC